MEFGLSSGDLINAGGAFLFFLAGIVILAVARRTRLGLRLGAFAVTFGLAYVASNLVSYGADAVSVMVHLVLELAAAVCLAFLIVEVLRPVSRTDRRRVAMLAAGIGLGVGIGLVLFAARRLEDSGGEAFGPSFEAFPLQFLVEPLLLVLLAASGQAPVDGSLPHYKGRVMLGLAAGLFAVLIIMVTAVTTGPGQGWKGSATEGVELLFGVLAAGTAWLVLHGCPPGAERFATRAFAAIVLVGFIGCLAPLMPDETVAIGPYGILRTIGAVLLVLAVVKDGVLGVPLPRLVVRRGALAGGALAVLFVVAQVAQNFFSAEFGLYVGGIFAGIFVFAASPVQRAIERLSQKGSAVGSRSATAGYKAALRAAMRDGTLTQREERHLAEVATALGISPVQALDLRDEVQRESA